MPVLETKGALSAQGYGLTTSQPQPIFIEDVFSTWLYTGNGSAQAIGNGIQLGAGATSPGWISTISSPSGSPGNNSVRLDSAGNIYVTSIANLAGSLNFQISKYNNNGVIQWQKFLAGSDSDVSESVAVDTAGNVYVCGYSNTSAIGVDDIILAKYNTNGVIQWQRRLSGSGTDFGQSIAVDTSGNVYICGYSAISGNDNFIIAKYNTNGVIQWQQTLGGAGTDRGFSVAVDSGSNVYVCGFTNTPTFALITAKYDTNGNIQWQRRLGSGTGATTLGSSVAIDLSDNVYVCGRTDVPGVSEYLIAKYNTNGVIQWQRTLGNPSFFCHAQSVAVDSSANVYVTGFIDSPTQFVIVKYDTNGVIQWQRILRSSTTGQPSRIAVDSVGNFYVCGASILAKFPGDGSGLGVYTAGSISYSYTTSFLTSATSTLTDAVSTLSSSTSSLTDSASSFIDSSSSFTVSTTALAEGPGRGGLVWMKSRSASTDHALYDTARGATFDLASNLTSAQTTQSTGLTGFLANGFSIGSLGKINTSAATYVSWTFREQPRFFDVVTYTGNGANRTIAHSLGSVPGCIMVKRLDASADWQVYHREVGPSRYMVLNSAAANVVGATRWNNTEPTATEFSLGTDATVNASGGTYVAYLFAHDAGGFGASGADNVISCGRYTGNGSATGPVVTLGYEPQWLLIKLSSFGTGDWNLIDNMRGFVVGGTDAELNPNLSNAESTGTFVSPTATGFQLNTTDAGYNASGSPYIYIAIRRGPMRTPTSGTQVYQPFSLSSTSTDTLYTTGFPVDMAIAGQKNSNNASDNWTFVDRLRGMTANSNSDGAASRALLSTSTAAEAAQTFPDFYNVWNTGLRQGVGLNGASTSYQFFRRAPGFFDVVCYTGDGASSRRVPANLAAVPQFVIVKSRSSVETWSVGTPYTVSPGLNYSGLRLNSSAAQGSITISYLYSAPPYVDLGVPLAANTNGVTYVAYAFASCPGVSRVGTYTGTGSTQTINCGFSSGARFVLIKRTDAAGDWYVWDTARGIVAANDPYLTLNTTAAEVTTTDWVDAAASGFELSNAAGNLVNINGASYIFLSIA